MVCFIFNFSHKFLIKFLLVVWLLSMGLPDNCADFVVVNVMVNVMITIFNMFTQNNFNFNAASDDFQERTGWPAERAQAMVAAMVRQVHAHHPEVVQTIPAEVNAVLRRRNTRNLLEDADNARYLDELWPMFQDRHNQEGAMNGIRDDVNALRTEVRDDVNALRTEVRDDVNALRTEVRDDVNALRTTTAA